MSTTHDAIEAAKEAVDPLEGLIERTLDDAGAPYAEDVLAALRALKKSDRPAFERLRAGLKEVKCRVTQLDQELDGSGDGASKRSPSQTDNLTELLHEAELFVASNGDCYADILVNGHRETRPVRSNGFIWWLTQRYHETYSGAPGSDALNAAQNMAEAISRASKQIFPVHLRVGSADSKIYLDLCDSAWRAVEIDAEGWRVISEPPVRFHRTAAMQALPEPQRGGSVVALRSFLNVGNDGDFVLTVSWLLAALRDSGPYPMLALAGEQGSAKSTFAEVLKALIDPCAAPLRSMSHDERDLFIFATNSHVLAFDNLSGLSGDTSDKLCRLATGGGFAVRRLYTDGEEMIFDAMRPMILNGIEDVVTRPDLADRSLFLTLDPIPEKERRLEADLWEAFMKEHPYILGGLLDAIAVGLKRLPETHLENLPRMADFAKWATACETSFTDDGSFMTAYNDNRDRAAKDVMEADGVAMAVRALMDSKSEWVGNATQLLVTLNNQTDESIKRSKAWPTQPNKLSGRLRRSVVQLRTLGIDIEWRREGRDRSNIIHISKGVIGGQLRLV